MVGLIARNVEAKDATVPVFVQNQLEDFTKSLFGIKALSMTFPTVNEMKESNIDDSIIQWIMAHTKQPKSKIVKNKPKITKRKLQKQVAAIEVCKDSPVVERLKPQKEEEIQNTAKCNDGFISFTEGMEVEKADSAEDEKHLVAVLNKVVERVEKQTNTEQDVEMKHIENMQRDEVTKRVDSPFSASDDFLPDVYQPLTVHKIQPNPNRKPKTKKQKKQKKNKQNKKNICKNI